MPILHRNIVPNVPAWTADNGKIVFRSGAPSHQRLMEFKVEFGGTFDMAPWLAYLEESASEYRDPTLTAAELNAALAATPSTTLASYPCNVNLDYYGIGTGAQGDGGLPAGDRIKYNYFHFNPAGGYDIYSGGVLTKRIDEIELEAGLEWDAVNTDWRWFARLYYLTVWFYLNRSGDQYHVATFNVSHSRYPFYAASPSTTDIRVGNGLSMPFMQIYNPSTALAWRAAALANSELIISAQAA